MSFTSATNFNWRAHAGTNLYLLLNKHPYADALIADLPRFTTLTGIHVKYDIFPEDVYFDKVTTALSSKSTQYDAFMTGAYQCWVYGPAGWMVDLNTYLKDPKKTNPAWAPADVFSNLLKSDSWNDSPGSALGTGNAHQWALPWGFELYSLSYNKSVFAKYKLKVPTNLPELADTAAYVSKKVPGMYGVAVRGSRSWATIHPGYLSAFTCYGARDFNSQLKASMNSPQAVEMTSLWVNMVQKGGPPGWTSYTWYEVGSDLGAGKAAMIYDADILGYFQNSGTRAAGHLAYAPMPANPASKTPYSNVWIWSLAMSNFSTKKDAAWYLMQWATGKDHLLHAATHGDMVDPVRASIWANSGFQHKMATYQNYRETFNTIIPHAKIYFTAEPLFFQVTTDWAASLQDMYAKKVGVKAGLDQLASSINSKMANTGI